MWQRDVRHHRSDEALVLDCVNSSRVRREIGAPSLLKGELAQGEIPCFPKFLELPGCFGKCLRRSSAVAGCQKQTANYQPYRGAFPEGMGTLLIQEALCNKH